MVVFLPRELVRKALRASQVLRSQMRVDGRVCRRLDLGERLNAALTMK